MGSHYNIAFLLWAILAGFVNGTSDH